MNPDEPKSMAVVNAVAEETNRSPSEIEPLAETVDPDALDVLLSTGGSATVTFEYAGYRVTVTPEDVRIEK